MQKQRHDFSESSSMPLVPQEHSLGCAVSCVASRLNISYAQALKLFLVEEYAWTRGYFCDEIVSALGKAGLNYTFSNYNETAHADLAKLPGTIIYVDVCDAYLLGHFFLRTKQGWMNPWGNCPQMIPVEACYQSILPGAVSYIIYAL